MTEGSAGPTPPVSAAVIGAGGFIGSAVSASLVRRGVPIAAYTSDRPAVQDDVLAPGLAEAGTVFLLAGGVNPASAERDQSAAAADKADLRRLLDLLSDAPATGRARPRRVVLAGSGGTVYDASVRPPYAETSPVAPVNAYGKHKLEMEDVLREFAGPLEPVVARLSNVYGPGQRLGTGQGVVAHWLAAASEGRPLLLFGDPLTTRDYLYIDDAASALVALHELPTPMPSVLNVGSGVPTTLLDLAELLRTAVGRPELEIVAAPARGFDRQDTWLDVRLAAEALGWAATTPLGTGLARSWRALSARNGAVSR